MLQKKWCVNIGDNGAWIMVAEPTMPGAVVYSSETYNKSEKQENKICVLVTLDDIFMEVHHFGKLEPSEHTF